MYIYIYIIISYMTATFHGGLTTCIGIHGSIGYHCQSRDLLNLISHFGCVEFKPPFVCC